MAVAGKGWGELQIRRVGGGDFTDFPAPASGSTDTGKVWAWNSATQSFEPRTFLLASAVGAFGLTMLATADAAAGRTALELGTAAVLNVGTSANNVVQLDGSSRLPAVDGSQLTGISGGSVAGSTTQVIFNDAGAYAGDAGLTYAKATDRLTVAGGLIAPSMRPELDGINALQWQNAAGVGFLTGDTTNLKTTAYTTVATGAVRIPLSVDSNGITRLAINSPSGSGNTGIGFYVNGGLKWSAAAYAAGGTNYSFVFFNDQAGGSSFFINGDTNNIGFGYGNTSPTAAVDVTASTTTRASLRIRNGTAPTSPNDGDIWFNGTNFQCRIGGVTKTFTVT